eukprot:6181295-Pleurochrysis_carterae.AAC.2
MGYARHRRKSSFRSGCLKLERAVQPKKATATTPPLAGELQAVPDRRSLTTRTRIFGVPCLKVATIPTSARILTKRRNSSWESHAIRTGSFRSRRAH